MLEEQTTEGTGATTHTPEELLEDGGHRWELIDGHLVERNMGMDSCEVAANILRVIGLHAHTNKLGRVFTPDLGFQIFPEANKVRYADVSFIARCGCRKVAIRRATAGSPRTWPLRWYPPATRRWPWK